jgi:hypothetical protein
MAHSTTFVLFQNVIIFHLRQDYFLVRQHLKVIKKLFIDLYSDDFGPFRNVYHSIGGLYLQFGNLPLHYRQKLKNHFLLGFVPFAANITDCIQPFINDLQRLQDGVAMDVDGEQWWVTGGRGVITADMPQGNLLSNVKKQSATLGCRACFASQEEFGNLNFDIINNARFDHMTTKTLKEIRNKADGSAAQKTLEKKYGLLHWKNPLDNITRDRHLQTPHDPFHAELGLTKRVIDFTFELLTSEGQQMFMRVLQKIDLPTAWLRFQNIISHRQSLFFSDYARLMMIGPFVYVKAYKTII